MAASVYATPPPDHLSGDETALSDVSNSSQISSPSNSMKTLKRSLSASSLLSTSSAMEVSGVGAPPSITTSSQNSPTAPNNATIPFAGNINISTLPSSIANTLDTLTSSNGSTANSDGGININSLSSLLLDSMPDNSKKRRKQSTPIRISETNKNAILLNAMAAIEARNGQIGAEQKIIDGADGDDDLTPSSTTSLSTVMPRIYLSNLSQLQEKSIAAMNFKTDSEIGNSAQKENGQEQDNVKKLSESHEQFLKSFVNNLNCDQCGLKLNSEIQLGLHILQEHAPKNLGKVGDTKSPEDEIPKIFVKKEIGGGNSYNNDDEKEKFMQMASNGQLKPEDWLTSLSNLPFAFPPEAAVMLSGYMPQLPLLGVPNNPFATADGLPRSVGPQLRIFNPEAYCDLCNKEFCNKYFLKTHKANKHNIYESATSSADTPTTSQLNQMSQVFQMHQQQMVAQQQLVSPKSPPQLIQQPQQSSTSSQRQSPSICGASQSAAPENTVMCDICFKRYPNVSAMRRHRSKTHEIPPSIEPNSDAKMSTNTSSAASTPITMPEGFREDYSIEQEDTTFTPQPRKLSPQSILQAREANFSYDKLKRLGVTNPESFCEICCKEYCNKYFLRTHKMKRHGIIMPLDDTILKDGRLMANAAAAAASAWQLMQNAPLNLIMNNAEAFSQLHNQRKKLEAGEVRKLSIESMDDDELEQPNKKRKLNENDKKQMDETDDGDDAENKSTDNQQDSENISVDLQKLQSMIMQLNDLNAQRPVMCGICGKEQENQFVLHTHMLAEHTNIGDNNNGLKTSPSTSPVINQATSETCKHCDKELPNAFALNQHLFEIHGISPTSPVRDGFVTPERPISGLSLPPQAPNAQITDRRPYTITPTSSYCEICNKELCNKYFMKTHMQRMHGIEIENGSQIGGVVCNICNKELCSKYFLRVHKHNTHGIVDDGSPLPQPRQNGEQIEPDTSSMFSSSVDSALRSGEITNDLNNRYFAHCVCPLCNRRFRDVKYLKPHLLNDHGKAGIDKFREIEQQLPKTSNSPPIKIPNGVTFPGLNPTDPNFMQKQALNSLFAVDSESQGSKAKEYQCSFCSFSTPSYAFLYIHKRSLHAALMPNEALAGLNIPNNDNNELSESAVSIAKDQQTMGLKSSSNETTSVGNTPISTPATTPIPIQLPAIEAQNISSLIHKENQIVNDVEMLLKGATQEQKINDEQQQQQQQRQDQFEAQNILAEMANFTKRPTTYAIPQEFSNGMFMQSFLLEPIDNDDVNGADTTGTGNTKTRFVPSVVFLPVRERVVGRTTVSFSLTPA
ncbi:uncharacterized protein LOC116342459 [Contarinia nasturtii]|uniref:uncharacterized protein LOC116342459 n=1 Tax=Contarinia nasturtii TaxID=265458 RepID=UPI0012D378EE|nr:uncharacterized protein LOC116342459 [Contarinia nasturtii]XP_031625947.1 uncharacterized protein LOC116342459 [Contarinia nasturtii]